MHELTKVWLKNHMLKPPQGQAHTETTKEWPRLPRLFKCKQDVKSTKYKMDAKVLHVNKVGYLNKYNALINIFLNS